MLEWKWQYLILPCILALTILKTRPKPRSGSVPVIPTAFPWLGLDNAIRWYRNPTLFMERAGQKYGPFYMFVVFGAKIAVLMHPYTLRQLERQSQDISVEVGLDLIAKASSGRGEVDRIVDVMLHELNPIATRTFAIGALKISGLKPRFHQALEIELDRISSDPREHTIVLSEFVRRTLYRTTCSVLFGPTFPISSYEDFKATIPEIGFLSSRFSRFSWSKIGNMRLRMLNCVVEYIRPWWDLDGGVATEGMSDLILEALVAMKGSGLTITESAAGILPSMWGIHSNLWFHLTWLMVQVLINDETRLAAEKEARSTTDITKMPFIDSAMYEALRWPWTVSQIRRASSDIDVSMNGVRYVIEKGTWIIPKLLNHDETVYANPFEFKASRFLDSSLPKPKTFGDGHHACKGMYIALHQMSDFVATSLRKFDIKIIDRKGKPRKILQNEGNSLAPDAGSIEEFTIRLAPRASSQ